MRRSDFVTLAAGMLGVLLLFVLVCVAPCPVHAQTIQSIGKVTVVDANGVDVGTFTAVGNTNAIVFRVGGRLFYVITFAQGFFGTDLYFADLNCQGAAFVRLPTNSVVPIAALYTPGATVFLPDPTAVSQLMSYQSAFKSLGSAQCTNETPFAPFAMVPAVSVIDLYTVFTPPFSARGTPATPVTARIFDDVSSLHPFFPFIQALAAEGITGGCNPSPPLFCPDAPFTRGQAAVFFGRALDLVP